MMVRRLRERRSRESQAGFTERRELRRGLLGVSVVVALLGAAGLFSVLPVGKHTYTAFATEAQSIAVGDGVRVAGISVGTVTELELEPDHVRLTFTVDRDVFVGRESSLDVRMLTIVGGHYIALQPAGDQPLGDQPIPADRVRLPYSLNQVFQDAIRPLDAVDGGSVNESLTLSGAALEAAPDSVRQVVEGLTSFADILDRQSDQVSEALAVVEEYSGALEQTKAQLARFVVSVNQLETTVLDKQAEMQLAGTLTVSAIQRIEGLEPAWQATVKPLVPVLKELAPELVRISENLDTMLATVRSLATRTDQILATDDPVIDDSGTVVVAPRLCVPVPGRSC
ncbi:MCE family protein (plasmid) [Rhodococcus sp. LW-XY12]|nr:MCE family protein [Rhodococcus sp. LW-XY12]